MVFKSKDTDPPTGLILIPTDFSLICENAVNHGMELARELKYRVCLLHVVNRNKKSHAYSKGDRAFSILQRLNAIKARYEARYPVEMDVLAINGKLPEVIVQVTAAYKAEFLILGINRKHKSLQYMGHHALEIVGDALCPVINLQEKPLMAGYKNIVVSVQRGKITDQVLFYIELYHRLFSSVIHVFLNNHPGASASEKGTSLKDEISVVFNSGHIPVSIEMADRDHDFAEQLLTFSVKMKADIIIVETLPEFNSSGTRISSWNEKMIFNEDQIAVMTVNPLNGD